MTAAHIRFSADDLAAFAQASHDRNPLHLSAAYARRTAFGQPLVHGALATLAALGRLRERPGALAARLTVDFPRPIVCGVDYEADVVERGADKATVTLRDGLRNCLRATVAFGAGTLGPPVHGAATPRVEAVDRPFESIGTGTRLRGEYAPAPGAAEAYVDRLDLSR